MAQEQQPQAQAEEQLTPLVALFPAPPPFYQNFTKQNVTELRKLRKEAGVPALPASAPPSSHAQVNGDATNGEGKKDIDILSLPSELRHLIPPQPPAGGLGERAH